MEQCTARISLKIIGYLYIAYGLAGLIAGS